MIYSDPIFNYSFENKESEIPILVVENKKYLQEMIQEIINSLDGEETKHSFYVRDKEVIPKKDVELIIDFFGIDINKTKNLTKLYAYIKSEYVNEKMYEETSKLITGIMNYTNNIVNDMDFQLIYDDNIELSTLLKAINLRFYYEESTLLEKLIDYIKIMNDFFKKKLFILIGFKSMFSNQEQEELYKFLAYNKIEIILIESEEPKMRTQNEIYRIIDEDLCVIY